MSSTMNLTREKFASSKPAIQAAELLFAAMAVAQSIVPVVEAYQRAILAKHRWPVAPKFLEDARPGARVNQIVLEPKSAWTLGEEHFNVFLTLCEEQRIAHNLQINAPGHCPALECQHLVIQAEQHLIEVLEPVTGVPAERILSTLMETRKTYVDLCLKLLAPFADPHSRFLPQVPRPSNARPGAAA